ncbi:hypothetical protein [Microbacterium luticocti]|uniref:hypothetical protein n=1 Tax=Microbacterium luticocti TaxID=451764 RepID=UPI0004129E0E|nr:hypothetical protein [Microbacterium luticocti]
MTDRLVSVELQKDSRIFIVTYSRTTDGHRLIDGVPIVVPTADDATALGEAVVNGLLRSTTGVLPPRDTSVSPPDAEFLRWAGVETYAKYAKGVRTVEVWADGDGELEDIEITPEGNQGARGGFVPLGDPESITFNGPTQLGEAVQRALALATA